MKNRYKASKDYRKYQDKVNKSPNDPHLQASLDKAKVSGCIQGNELLYNPFYL